jgi:hypothetical protein
MNNKSSNSGITLTDVRTEAFDAIQKLKNKELDIKTAAEIRNMLNVVIDTAKTQVDFIKFLPNKMKEHMNESTVKIITGTLHDTDPELDKSLAEIEERRKKPYEFDQ